jgi:hypothetical protein
MNADDSRHSEIAALVARCTGFEWDAGNINKNWKKHRVSDVEAEEIFGNEPLQFSDDPKHSMTEPRFGVLGKTDGNRLLSLVFTIRARNIRVISARPMSRNDRNEYDQQES